MFIGKNVITLTRVDSTNNYAKQLLANSRPVPEGTVILAEEQTAGRGQAQNAWQSEAGKNLTISLLLYPAFLHPADQFYLNMAVSLGLAEGLDPFLEERVYLKWPNDIYSTDKKLGGLLIENFLAGQRLKASVIGMGINVNQENFEGLPRATSLRRERGLEYSLEKVLTGLCEGVEGRYLQLKGGAHEPLKAAYLERLLGFNQLRLFERLGKATVADDRESGAAIPDGQSSGAGKVSRYFQGKICDVSHEGRLVLETAGERHAFDRKEIAFHFDSVK